MAANNRREGSFLFRVGQLRAQEIAQERMGTRRMPFLQLNAGAVAQVERELRIRRLREENETPAAPMSHACRVCSIDYPHQRVVSTACGHSICRDCALKLKGEASDENKQLKCPLCQTGTAFVAMYEDRIDDNGPVSSRSCRVCLVDCPHRRAVFTACGHAICLACAEQLDGAAREERRRPTCPFCRAVAAFVPLIEEPV